MKNKIVLAGGSGFLGKLLAHYYVSQGWEVVVLSRSYQENRPNISFVKWDGKTLGYWSRYLEHAAVLVNLNGKSVDCRYTEQNKQLIYDSRLDATRVLSKAFAQCENPPKVWLNSSSATIYRHSEDCEMTEENGELGTGFSVDVCKKWEHGFFETELPQIRKIALRTSIVLGKRGGALQPLIRLVKCGLGGKQGSGHQYFSWIHELDFIHAVDFLIHRDDLSGCFNLASPNPIPNQSFMKYLREALRIKFGLPSPRWLLEIGAMLIRTETELILKSRRVVPERLLAAGFYFEFPFLKEAFSDLVTEKP